jgi:hypothetical protein
LKLGRNDPCHCGSGNKYKKCCAAKDEAELLAKAAAEREKALADAAAAPPVEGAETLPDSAKRNRPSTPPPRGGASNAHRPQNFLRKV